MDFLKILRSFEELLYEVITWLFFYPRTLCRILFHPLKMVKYTTEQLASEELPFKDTISPPLFLLLTLIILYAFGLITHNQVLAESGSPSGDIGHFIFGNIENTLIFRSLSYSIWSLIFALGLLKMQNISIDRETLRAPFFAQCFLIAPYALGLTIGFIYITSKNPLSQISGLAIVLLSWLWYIFVQIKYIVITAQCSYFRAISHITLYFGIGCILSYLLGYIIIHY
ncbi:hypothetical protein [Acinetobacter modestus]|uniref:hypothetical protein n=1 Tax=Acinetobacter modestus TaxID=1776740 RepID=UPI001F4B7F5F|nr:hypothetical protein [Acinetobacter modestus]MCH7330627.1 hypothetical protein [Acinetobacter modestus]